MGKAPDPWGMALSRAALTSLWLLTTCLLAASAAPADAAELPPERHGVTAGSETAVLGSGSGGATAPAADGSSGGAEYGAVLTKAPPTRPVATRFSVTPGSTVEGTALRVRLRVDELGVPRVDARLVFYPVAGKGQLLRANIGRIATGHTITGPSVTGLAPGEYTVRLHVKDPKGATLLRLAKTSGRATLTVRAKPAPKPVDPPAAPSPPPSGPLPVVAPPSLGDPAESRGVFPVQGAYGFGGVDARFGAGRPGHIHQGQDMTASSGTPVVAPTSGVITTLAFQEGGAGQYVMMRSGDGRSFFFAHLIAGSTSRLKAGQGVSAGQPLGLVGTTGSSSGPHLHFEIWVGGWRVNSGSHPIDPLPQLLAWKR